MEMVDFRLQCNDTMEVTNMITSPVMVITCLVNWKAQMFSTTQDVKYVQPGLGSVRCLSLFLNIVTMH